MRQVQEERTVLALLDELQGLLGIALRDQPLVGLLLDDLLHPQERKRRVPVGLAARVMTHVVRERDSEVVVEALPSGQEFALIAEVPLPDDGGLVAHILEDFGDCDLVRMQALLVAREQHPPALLVLVHAYATRVAPGHQGAARGCADVRRYVEAGQLAAFNRHPVQIRRPVQLRAERSDVGVTEVVDEDQDEVGLVGCCCDACDAE